MSEKKKYLSISIDENIYNILKRRAKRNLLTMEKQVDDILRRSCVNVKTKKKELKTDDPLVNIFSKRKYKRRYGN